MRKAICGWQKSNKHRLVAPIRITFSDIEVFTGSENKYRNYSIKYKKRLVANRVFERGYKEFLKTLHK